MRLIIFIITTLPLLVYGQTSILDEYVKIGLQNNANVRTQNLRVNQQAAALNEAKGLNLPQVSFNATYSVAAGGRKLEFPVGDLLNPVYSTLNDLTGQAAFPQIDNVSETFLPHNFQETKIRVQQNIFNRDIQHNYRAQEQLLNLENAKQATVAADLEKDIRMAYVQYLQANRVTDIYAAAEMLVREVLRVNQSLVKNGKATRDVIYDAQFELDKIAQEQAKAQQNIQAARAYFNYLLQRDLNEPIQIDTTIQNRFAAIALPDLKSQSVTQRTELQQLKIATAANREQIERWQDKKLPSAYAVVDLGMQGTGYRPQDQGFVFALLGVQWDLFTGFQNREREQQATIEEQILLQQQTDLQQKIQLQIHQIYYQLQAARSAVTAAESGIRNTQQRFNIINKRYKNQQANLLQLMDARTDLTTAEIQLAVAAYSVKLKEIELVWASGGF